MFIKIDWRKSKNRQKEIISLSSIKLIGWTSSHSIWWWQLKAIKACHLPLSFVCSCHINILTCSHSLSTRASKPRIVLHLGSKIIWAIEVTCSVESVPSVPWTKTDAPSLRKSQDNIRHTLGHMMTARVAECWTGSKENQAHIPTAMKLNRVTLSQRIIYWLYFSTAS